MTKTPIVATITLALAALAPAPRAQQVWVVDDDAGSSPDFTDLQTAIDTVASGDILLVKTGLYSRMRIDGKGLTIQAESGAQVDVGSLVDSISPQLCGQAEASVCNLAPTQSVRLRGLSISAKGQGLLLASNAGLVWIEDCAITCPVYSTGGFSSCGGSGAGISASDCADVVLVRSAVLGTNGVGGVAFGCGSFPPCFSFDPEAGPGLLVESSEVHAFGCTFVGGDGIGQLGSCECAPQKGGYGIRGSGDPAPFLFLSGCTVEGGRGVGCVFDKVCYPCTGPHNEGGDGLYWKGTAAVLDSEIEEGPAVPSGGTCGSCPPLTDGMPITSLPELDLGLLPGRAVRMQVSSPVRENGSVDMTFVGHPRAPTWLLSSLTPIATFGSHPRGTLLLGDGPVLEFVGFTDATGTLQRTVTLGPFPPGVEGRAFFLQGLVGNLPSPGGKCRLVPAFFPTLGEGSMLVGLDSSF